MMEKCVVYFMKLALTTVLLLITAVGFTQQHNVEIIGEIVDSESKEAIPYVHIVNKNTGQGTASNTEGRFWINMSPADTLIFSAIGFESYQFRLNEQITTDKLVVTIELSQSTLELEAVKVFAFKDEYALKRALIDAEVSPEEDTKQLQLPGVKRSARPVNGGGVAVGGPLTALGNLFSKERKETKKMETLQQEYNLYKNIESKYNPRVVMDITGLPEDKVEDFMNFCKIDDGYIRKATEYELAVVVNRCLVDFNALEEK